MKLYPVYHFVALDLMWKGHPVNQERLDKWGAEAFNPGRTIISMTRRKIIDHHDAEVGG